MKTEFSLPFNQPIKIKGFTECSKADQQFLIQMGIIPGTLITLIRTAPLGDPIEVCVRNICITLPKALIQKLQIEILQ